MDFLFSSKSKIMKNDDLTREDIKRIIDNLYSTIGVRMRVDMDDFHKVNYSDHVSQDSFPDIVEVFTNHLELPVKIVPVFSSVFESRDIVFNKENSVMGVSAQIHIPYNLPWHKTSGMVNFPVTITVAPESFDQGLDTLMTKLSHEFSHLYLHSRRDPQRESEYATDLCALMMGFSSFWKRGRKYEKHQANRILVITQGYLSDSQFTYAMDYIEQLRLPFWRLIKDISSLRRTIPMNYDPIGKYLHDVYLLYDFHFKHPGPLKSPEDASVFSKLAQNHYKSDIEEILKESTRGMDAMIVPAWSNCEFKESDKKWLEEILHDLETHNKRLERTLIELRADYDVLMRNIDVEHYSKILDNRKRLLEKELKKANKDIKKFRQQIELLEIGTGYLQNCGRKSESNGSDAKSLSLICNPDFAALSLSFADKQQEKLDEINEILTKAKHFYDIDDAILLTKIQELENVRSTLEGSLKSHHDNIKVVMRNLNFTDKIKFSKILVSGLF